VYTDTIYAQNCLFRLRIVIDIKHNNIIKECRGNVQYAIACRLTHTNTTTQNDNIFFHKYLLLYPSPSYRSLASPSSVRNQCAVKSYLFKIVLCNIKITINEMII